MNGFFSSNCVNQTSHLFVLVPGMWGGATDFVCLEQILEEKKDDHDFILVSTANKRLKSYHGIDVCGNRLVREVKRFVKRKRILERIQIAKISFIAFSAGGIFAKYAIGVLYEQRFFQVVQPIHYISLATPHMGIRNSHRKKSGRVLNMLAEASSNLCGGRSMDQLCLVDDKNNPLMLQMSLPNSTFIAGLSLFNCTLYANVRNDKSTPYCTSALALRNPYHQHSSRSEITTLPGYTYICKESRVEKFEKCSFDIEQESEGESSNATHNLAEDVFFHGCVLPMWLCQGLCILAPLRPFTGSYNEKDLHSSASSQFDTEQQFDTLKVTIHSEDDKKCHVTSFDASTPTSQQTSILSYDSEEEDEDIHGDVGLVSEVSINPTELEKCHFEEIHRKIRENLLGEITFSRVDCWLPGIHTHSKMIVREGLDCFGEGKEIMEHVAILVTEQ